MSSDYTIEIPFHFYAVAYHGKGKEPFWNRIGKRFVPDIAVKKSPSYCVELVDYPEAEPFVMTLYWVKLSTHQQHWWYAKRSPKVLVTQTIAQNSEPRQKQHREGGFSQQAA